MVTEKEDGINLTEKWQLRCIQQADLQMELITLQIPYVHLLILPLIRAIIWHLKSVMNLQTWEGKDALDNIEQNYPQRGMTSHGGTLKGPPAIGVVSWPLCGTFGLEKRALVIPPPIYYSLSTLPKRRVPTTPGSETWGCQHDARVAKRIRLEKCLHCINVFRDPEDEDSEAQMSDKWSY
jgi:hypothetical protein